MVICEICKRKLNQINNVHLKMHNMTVKEYEAKYPNSERYTSKVKPRKIDFVIDEGGCFICTSHAKRLKGYYNYRPNGIPTLLHRFVYEECYGPIGEGLLVRHKCDNRYCINPEHLEIGTHADNMKDMYTRKRQRHYYGQEHPAAKLTEKDVIEILKYLEKGVSGYKLAEKYGVGKTAIFDIKEGNKWKHLTNKEDFKAVCLDRRIPR